THCSTTETYTLSLHDALPISVSIDTEFYPDYWTDVLIDDVSCIEVNLPAYAGRDTTILIGDSVYIGREKDFAIDTGCVWYKLPRDRKSTRLNSSHVKISYAVF